MPVILERRVDATARYNGSERRNPLIAKSGRIRSRSIREQIPHLHMDATKYATCQEPLPQAHRRSPAFGWALRHPPPPGARVMRIAPAKPRTDRGAVARRCRHPSAAVQSPSAIERGIGGFGRLAAAAG